jgi:6,7-dimethyl-8-ribityllumazine synthase
VSVFEGRPRGAGRRIAIVAARFNEVITRKLVEGAVSGLEALGVAGDDIDVAWVPGAFEIPLVARRLARSGRFDGVICLGAVIRGETAHFDLVANEAARGVADAARDAGIPVIFEVLAVENLAQAEARAGGAHGNKGWEAAEAVLSMVSLLEELPGDGLATVSKEPAKTGGTT